MGVSRRTRVLSSALGEIGAAMATLEEAAALEEEAAKDNPPGTAVWIQLIQSLEEAAALGTIGGGARFGAALR